MPFHQRRRPFSARHAKASAQEAGRLEQLLTQFQYLEDLLLLWGVPALIGALLLWAIGSSVQGSLLFLTLFINLLVTLLVLLLACLLFLRWIDTLRVQGRTLLQKRSDENIFNFALTCCTSALLVGLILATVQTGGGDPRTALLLLVFLLLGWHYRTLLKRVPRIPPDTSGKTSA